MAVSEVPIGQNYRREEMASRGQPELYVPTSGRYGMRCIMVQTLPEIEDQEEDVLYFVKA